jgi:dTMP kinase
MVLIALEGIDGAGKSTQVQALQQILTAAEVPFVSTREPTDGPWGQKIRASAQTGRMSAEDELAAFVEDRREHVREVIRPALRAGSLVLVDRYFPSTVAYQGARGLDPARLLEANAFAPVPDATIVLDIDPKVGLARVCGRGDQADLFEKEDELERVRAIFRDLPLPGLHLIDATQPPDVVTRQIARLVFDAWSARTGDRSVSALLAAAGLT